jgi:hypothetical protein
VFTKFTSSTTIGDTEYDVHETPSDGTLSFGSQASPSTYGQIGHQKSTFGNPGDAQSSQIILMNYINSATSADLFSNYPTNTAYINGPVGAGAMAFSGQLIAQNITTGDTSHFEIKATFKTHPTVSLVGTYTIISIAEDVPSSILVKVSINSSTSEIIVNVANNSGGDIQCVCYVRYTQTFFFI